MKTRKIYRSKYKFPTRQIRGSRPGEGSLVLGEKTARQDIERKEGKLPETAKKCHNRFQWCWRVPA